MYHDTGYSTSNDRIQAQVSTNGTTWTNVGTAVSRYSATTGWTQATIDLSAYKGQTVYLGFLGISAYGNNISLDDVTVTGQ
ncbi:MAG: choice-of-anchor J domain-containing protein [Holophagales bacterium]|nr:choice-of-anchor J domain-containing protein [Holophagales bacterium]